LPHLLGIEGPAPRLERPTADADTNLARHDRLTEG
jgi:hypothetical protein